DCGRDVVAIVDRVEVSGRARVSHERLAGEQDAARDDLLADDELHHSPCPTSSTLVAVTTCSPSAVEISASLVIMALPPTVRMPVTRSCADSSSPATIGRVYAKRCSA